MINTQDAFAALRRAMREDPDYAWGWHCNVAMAIKDEGMPHAIANRAAARFMQSAFDIDMTQNQHYLMMFPLENNRG